MFEELINQPDFEPELFEKVVAAITPHYDSLGDEIYFCTLTQLENGKAVITSIKRHDDKVAYKDFMYSHKLEPRCTIFQRRPSYVKIVSAGYTHFMVRHFDNKGYSNDRSEKRSPNEKRLPVPPRELMEGAIAELKGILLASNSRKPM